MEEYISSFLISLAAGLVTPWFQKQPDKTVEESLDRYFLDALWDWQTADNRRTSHYQIENYHDLLKYIKDGQSIDDNDIKELIDLWQKNLMADQATAAFLENFKLDNLHQETKVIGGQVAEANDKLNTVGGWLASVDGKVDGIDAKLDTVRASVEAIQAKKVKHSDDSNEKTSTEAFRKKKDLDHLQKLMEAFSIDLLTNLCCEYPDSIDFEVIACYDVWVEAFRNPLYQFYDKELDNVVRSFFQSWTDVVKFGELYYFSDGDYRKLRYGGLKGDMFLTQEDERIYNNLLAKRQALYPHFIEMISYIRDNYDIDIEELSMKAFRQ